MWAAAWLYRATNDTTYLNTAESLYKEFGLQYWNRGLDWDDKVTGVQVRCVQKLTFNVSDTTVKSQMLIDTVNHRHIMAVCHLMIDSTSTLER